MKAAADRTFLFGLCLKRLLCFRGFIFVLIYRTSGRHQLRSAPASVCAPRSCRVESLMSESVWDKHRPRSHQRVVQWPSCCNVFTVAVWAAPGRTLMISVCMQSEEQEVFHSWWQGRRCSRRWAGTTVRGGKAEWERVVWGLRRS